MLSRRLRLLLSSAGLLLYLRSSTSRKRALGGLLLCLYFGYKDLYTWLLHNCLRLPFTHATTHLTDRTSSSYPLRKGTNTVRLSRGHVCYQYHGVKQRGTTTSSPLVVLVHGFVGSHAYFDSLASTLTNDHGRRVLCYDNYGRGHSNWDGTPQTVELFVGQLAELLFVLGETAPIDLVGYSMGGSIANKFAQTYPSTVHSLSLLSPATGTGDVMCPCRYNPNAVQDLIVRVMLFVLRHAPSFVGRRINAEFKKAIVSSDNSSMWNNPASTNVQRYMQWMAVRVDKESAMGASIASTLSYFPLFGGATSLYGGLSPAQYPVYLGWGARDNGPGTHYGYAEECFVAMGGVAHRPNETDRHAVLDPTHLGLTQGNAGRTPFNACGRMFEWYKGGHGFVIENGEHVAERLAAFWSCKVKGSEQRQLSWRFATAADVSVVTGLIEDAYKLGDDFFVDYDHVDPNSGEKYTRTSTSAIRHAIASSEAERGNKKSGLVQSTFVVGEVVVEGARRVKACLHVHSCNVYSQAEISFLTVDASVQGRGVAKEAMNVAETIAINAGYLSIGIDVVSTKPCTYRRMGLFDVECACVLMFFCIFLSSCFLTGLSTFYQKQGYQLTGESTKWPVPQYLKVGYKDMYFWRQAKSILPGVGVDGDLTIHTDYDTQHSPRTQNMYNTLDDDEE